MTAVTLALCETSTAGPLTPNHVRQVGPEGLKLGGGIPTPALCGRDLRGGWDLRAVDAAELQRLADGRTEDGRPFVHPDCASLALDLFARNGKR